MSSNKTDFDADMLFARKSNHCGFRFCPRCAGELKEKLLDGRNRMVCTNDECDFVFYQNPIPASGAIIVQEDSILLVKRAHPPRVGWWCIPAGFMEWDEHPTSTAVRELREETGLKIQLTSFFEVYSGNDDPRTNALLILYIGKIVGGNMAPSDDASEVRFFKFDEIPDKIAFEAHIQAIADYNARFRR